MATAHRCHLALLGCLFGLLFTTRTMAAEPEPLPTLNLDVAETSISGLSSGAFMAMQFAVAHSALIKGAGIVAGGPYYCAQANVLTATTRCSCTLDARHAYCNVSADSADVGALTKATRRFAQDGLIDDPRHLADQRVMLIGGGQDTTVPLAIVKQLRDYLQAMGVANRHLKLEELAHSGHAFPTMSYGSACGVTDAPYINDCDFDAAGRMLEWIYGPLQAARTGARRGRFIEFDQRPFRPAGFASWTSGLDSSGWLYVPEECRRGNRCRLHIALHGCRQGQSYTPLASFGRPHFGTTFVENAGYDAWADTNHIVVLFPQAVSVPMRNPNGCWDWWGYTDAHYADQRGVQIGALRAMVDRLTGGAR